jgi:hypothetical protein
LSLNGMHWNKPKQAQQNTQLAISQHKSHWTDTHPSQNSISYPWPSPISKHQVLVVPLTLSTIPTIDIRSWHNIQTWNSRHTSPCNDTKLHNKFLLAHIHVTSFKMISSLLLIWSNSFRQ